jgi:phage baseplate assembly protein W
MAYRIPNKHPLDINQRVAVGVAIPFSGPAVFISNYTTAEQVKSNLINYILTNSGERVLNPNFGANLRAKLFDQIDDVTLNGLELKLTSDITNNFPSLKIQQLTLTQIYEQNAIQLVLVYSVLNNTPETIQIIL